MDELTRGGLPDGLNQLAKPIDSGIDVTAGSGRSILHRPECVACPIEVELNQGSKAKELHRGEHACELLEEELLDEELLEEEPLDEELLEEELSEKELSEEELSEKELVGDDEEELSLI